MKWNMETAEEIIRQCERLTGVTANFALSDKAGNGELMNICEEKRQVSFSPLMCNDEDMPENIVKQCFFLAFCGMERDALGIGLLWNNAVEFVERLCTETGTEFTDFEEVESFVRPVRRKLFPDPKNGGCFFRTGDILREKGPCSGGCKFVVTDIEKTEEGIMVSYRILPSEYFPDNGKVYTDEEVKMSEWFRIYERTE